MRNPISKIILNKRGLVFDDNPSLRMNLIPINSPFFRQYYSKEQQKKFIDKMVNDICGKL